MSANAQPIVPTVPSTDMKAVAIAAATELLNQRDAQVAIANKIESLTNAANHEKARASELETKVGTLTNELEAIKAEAAKAKKDAEDSKKAADKYGDDLKAEKAKAEKAVADLATANKALASIQIDSTINTRRQAIATAGIKAESFATRAVAKNEDGSLKMADVDFTATLEDLKAVANVAPANGGTAAGTPAPATAANAAPAGQTQATANTVVPAPPDLTAAGMYQHASAALMNGATQPTAEGRTKFANAFGSEG